MFFFHSKSVSENYVTHKDQDLLMNPLWYNPKVSAKVSSLPDWYNKGLHTIGNLVNENKVMSFNQIKSNYSFDQLNYLNYVTVYHSATKFIREVKNGDQINMNGLIRPFVPAYLECVMKAKRGFREIYRTFLYGMENDHARKAKWTEEIDQNIDDMT